MISCSDFLNELSNYIDGEVAADIRAQLETHLAHCRSCSVLIDSTRKTVQIVVDSECFDLPADILEPITDHIMSRIQKHVEDRNHT